MKHSLIKKILFAVVALSILFIAGFWLLTKDNGYLGTDNKCLEGFYIYPLDRGYGPGSIITAEKSWYNNEKIKVSSLQFSSSRLKSQLLYENALEIESLGDLSNCSSIEYRNLDARVLLKSDSSSLTDVEVSPSFSTFDHVEIKVGKGKRMGLKNGESAAFQDIMNHLPATELENILREINRKNDLFFISEVAVYDEASISMIWNDSLSEEARTNVISGIQVSGIYEWSSANSLDVNFAEGSNVGFVGRFITQSDIDFIELCLEKRVQQGTLIRLYEDKDRDGFGSNTIGQSKLFGDKDDHKLAFGSEVVFYVRNNLDTDDNNNNRGPGELEWFLDSDKDGYGDAGSTIIGIKCPEGYVSNSQDCYDNNPNVFPGQTRFFPNHRGDNSFDYDCSSTIQAQFTVIGGCVNSCRAKRDGWVSGVPSCGTSAAYVSGCDNGNWTNRNCTVHSVQKVQHCR